MIQSRITVHTLIEDLRTLNPAETVLAQYATPSITADELQELYYLYDDSQEEMPNKDDERFEENYIRWADDIHTKVFDAYPPDLHKALTKQMIELLNREFGFKPRNHQELSEEFGIVFK